MAILVTGGTGFTGVNVVRDLAEAGHQVVSVDVGPPDGHTVRYLAPFADQITQVTGDLLDPSVLEDLGRDHVIDDIVNAAAYSPYDDDEKTRFRFVVDNNLGSLLNLIDFARAYSVRRLITVSSIGVYTSPEIDEPTTHISVDELRRTDPGHVYGISKLAEEAVAARAGELFGFEGIAVRMAQAWGPMERTTPYHSKVSIPRYWAHQAVQGEPIEASPVGVGPARGRQLNQDQAYVLDVASGIRALLDAPQLRNSVYNLSAGGPVFVDDMVAAIRKAEPDVRFTEPLVHDSSESSFGVTWDTSRLTADTGWRPSYDLASSFSHCIAWLRESEFPG